MKYYPKFTAIMLIFSAILANIWFIGLGSVFNYPEILKQPPEFILQTFSQNATVIMLWFFILALSAGLMTPIALQVGKMGEGMINKIAIWAGILASTVQVIGLSRWFLIVPGFSERGDVVNFEWYHMFLGTFVGETLGYFFTGIWTILIIRAGIKHLAGIWFSFLGYISSFLILLGIFSPLGIGWADIANFIGYVLWSLWLIILGILIFRKHKI